MLPLIWRGRARIELAIAIDQRATARVREKVALHAVTMGEMQGQAGTSVVGVIAARAVQDAKVKKQDATSGKLDR